MCWSLCLLCAIVLSVHQSINSGGLGLGINVDVSNQTFWIGQKFETLARSFLSCMDRKWENRKPPNFSVLLFLLTPSQVTYDQMRSILAPVKIARKDGSPTWAMSEAFKALRRLQNIRFEVKHRGSAPGNKEYKVRRFVFDPDLYGEQGGHAKAVTFDRRMEDGSTQKTSIADYYLQKYKVKITHWYLPVIETTRAGYFPMEVCEVHRFNPYPFKLDPAQVCPRLGNPLLVLKD